MTKRLLTNEETLQRLLKTPQAIQLYLETAQAEKDPRAYMQAKKNVAMVRRIDFLITMRKPSHKNCFDEYLESMDSEDVGTIKRETKGVLTFMKAREVEFEDFPDLLENRLRIIWDMKWK